MLRVYACITQEHDPRLVLVAAAICFIAAFTAFSTYDQARTGGKQWRLWGLLTAIVSGIGIWSTHFVAMLAYQPDLPIGYHVPETLLSVLTAIVVTGIGWVISLIPGRRGALLGGLIIGGGIGAMHYLGMGAVRVMGWIAWDQALVLVSVLLGMTLSVAALELHRRAPAAIPWRASLLLTLAICSLHFVAMGAAVIYPDPTVGVPPESISDSTLAIAVAAVAFMILAISFAVVLFDRNLARRQAEEAQRLKAMAEALKRQADISRAALSNMAQGLSMFDSQNRLITFNKRYAELYLLPAELLTEGRPLRDVLSYLVDNGVLPKELDYYLGETGESGAQAEHSELTLGDGRIIDVQRRPMPEGGWLATHEDITERRQAAQHIAYLAKHDPLTGLPNRASFNEHLQASAERLGRGSRFALHTVDLDRFKELNDTLGHPVGDEVLKKAAARLTAVVRQGDLVTRLGGDEFAVIQTGLETPDEAGALAKRIIDTLSQPFEFDGHTLAIGASVGIAFAPDDAIEPDDLLKKSDLALYRAKDESRGTYRLFEPGMDARLRERRELENDLRLAIQQGQFELHYQPIVDLSSSRITAFEALIRWRHPERGMVMPGTFIAAAEESGLIIAIGEWVLRQACRDAASWPAEVRVAVNLSAAQFKRGDMVSMVTNALAAASLPPERLELEITESVLLHDETWVLSVLRTLKALGIRIAMDDFGTGYSSLSYLRAFPFSKIKIDQSFVADLDKADDGKAIVQATIELSRKLGMTTTAEGVETAGQMNMLASEGCTEAQGFHISRPVPVEDVARLLARHNAAGAARAA